MACDDNNPLPEHLSTEEEIEELERLFEFILNSTFQKDNAFLITIARYFFLFNIQYTVFFIMLYEFSTLS